MKKLIFTAFAVLLVISCGENSKSSDNDSSVEKNDSDNQTEYVKTEPQNSFFENSAQNKFIFDFKSLINSVEAVESQKAISGVGDFTFHFGDEKLSLKGDKHLFSRKYPDDYEEGALAGKEYIQLNNYSLKDKGTLENGNILYSYDYLSMGLPTTEFKNLKKSNENELILPELSWITLYSYFVVQRADKKYFKQYCPISGAENELSKLFVDHESNDTFSAGENLILWGNITMSEPLEITDDNKGQKCIFLSHEGKRITKEQFDEEITKTGTDFSCKIPEDFFDKKDENFLKFKFRGKINGNGEVEYGFTEFAQLDLDETIYRADNHNSASGLTNVIGKSAVYVQMVGDYNLIDNTAATFNELQLYLLNETLDEMKENQENRMAFSPENIFNFFSVFHRTKNISVDGKLYAKSCPIALLDSESKNSEIFVCLNEKSEFTSGNEIEVAGRITVTDDEKKISQYFTDNGCTCYAIGGDEKITCEDFDNMEK